MKTTQKALSILLTMLLVFTCIPTAWAAEVSSHLESAVESSVESTPPEESNPSSEPESGPESETPEPSVTPEATPSQEPTTAPAPVSDPYVEHFEIIDAEFGGEYVMVAPEAEDITQEFSRSHQALDIAAPAGSPVLAADEGTVTVVQAWDGSRDTDSSQSYGHMVQVKHSDGNSTLYSLQEVKAGEGYLLTDGEPREFTIREDGQLVEYKEGDAWYNQAKRGDLEFVKVAEDDMHRLAGVPFKLTSQTTGESYVLVTDKNGQASTANEWNAHSEQTIQIHDPEIGTKATVDGEKQAEPLKKITLVDEVAYSGLTPGKGYTIKGVLMDKATGEKLLVDDKEVTATTEFTPDEPSGTVNVPFTFDASGLQGKNVVVFETLYHRDIELAVHADIEDADQTVSFGAPELKTTATIGGKKEAAPAKELVLEDVVAYKGLTPGKEYAVKGVLLDKSTGKKFLVGDKEVAAEATFTPEKPDGEVKVTFKFDGSAIKRKTELVVFETLYLGKAEIAAHADLEDKGQTVTITPPQPGSPDVPKTGDTRNILVPLVTLGVAIAGLVGLALIRRRKHGFSQTDTESDDD